MPVHERAIGGLRSRIATPSFVRHTSAWRRETLESFINDVDIGAAPNNER